jgi:hypothetical protein
MKIFYFDIDDAVTKRGYKKSIGSKQYPVDAFLRKSDYDHEVKILRDKLKQAIGITDGLIITGKVEVKLTGKKWR